MPFGSRGQRFTEWAQLLRQCWTGMPEPFSGEHYRLPAGLHTGPPPAHHIPLLVGGHSRIARSRAARLGDGWLGQQSALGLDAGELRSTIAELRGQAASGTDPAVLRAVLRIVDSAGRAAAVAAALPELAAAGVTEIIVDVDWAVPGAAAATCALLRSAAAT